MVQLGLFGDAVPGARTSYPLVQSESSPADGSCDQMSHASWLTPERAAAALVRAARRSGKPLEADQLAAAAGIAHVLGGPGSRRLIAELARAGELILERRQHPNCLWARIEVYSAPREAGR